MKKRKGKVFVWLAAMVGLIFFMFQIVTQFRSSRGEKQIQAAYQLLDQGDFTQGIAKLEEAEDTYDLTDEDFPEIDTLFGLYLRVEEWNRATRKLNQMYWRGRSENWITQSIRLIRATKEKAPNIATDVAADLVRQDEYLERISYPEDLKNEFGAAMAEKLMSDEYYDGFQRVYEWSDDQKEWWYYYADDGEEMHMDRFRNAINLAFLPHKDVIVDVFEPLPGFSADRDYIGLKGRMEFTGSGTKDSTFLFPEEIVYDSIDLADRWLEYAGLENFDIYLFRWNTAMMSKSIEKPFYDNMPYVVVREFVRLKNSDILVDFALLRGLLVQNNDDLGCDTGKEIDCWMVDTQWLAPFPDEFIELWIEKFPEPTNSIKPLTNRREVQKLSLARDLSNYLEARRGQ